MQCHAKLFQVCLLVALVAPLGCKSDNDNTGSSHHTHTRGEQSALYWLNVRTSKLAKGANELREEVAALRCEVGPCREECLDPIGTENVPEICGVTCEAYPCQPICGIPDPDVCRVARIAGL